ncbi:MAG: tetratricopeptide repeat protein, partial [Thermodesulfobacteriota bacterium]
EEVAGIYVTLGERAKAIEEYRRLIVEKPAEAGRFRYRIAAEYMKANDFDRARAEFGEILRSSPRSPLRPEIHYQLAAMYHLEGRLEDAMEAYDTVISEFPDHMLSIEARLGVASALEESGRLAEALERFVALEGDYPNKEVVRIRIASIEERLKKGPAPRKKKK